MNEAKATEASGTDQRLDPKAPISNIRGSDTARIDYAALYNEKARAKAA